MKIVFLLVAVSMLVGGLFPNMAGATDATSPQQDESYIKEKEAVKPSMEYATGVLDSIIITGNKKTHRAVILNEMILQSGHEVTSQAISRDKKRLESMGLFSRVEITTLRTEKGVNLVVDVTELWYIWPGIYLSIDENVPSRITYGLIISHNNFRGRAEELSFAAWMGNSRGGELKWKIPYIAESPKWFAEMKLKSIQEDEPLFLSTREGVVTNESIIQGKLGHRFNQEVSFWGAAGVEVRGFDLNGGADTTRPISVTGDETDWLMNEEIGFQIDTRHYKPWASQGFYLKLLVEASQTLDAEKVSYIRPLVNMAVYRELLPHFVWAGQVMGGYTFGDATVYRRILLDRNHLVRTPLEEAFEGDNMAAFRNEFRLDVLPITYVTFDPAFEQLRPYTRNLKFGMSLTLFSDVGLVNGVRWNPDDPESRDAGGWDAAYGTALVLHVPYRDVLRLELSRSARFPDEGLMVKLRIGAAF